MLIRQDSRQLVKRTIQSGSTPFITTGSTDHTDGTWLVNQIYPGEFYLNMKDKRMWIGFDSVSENGTLEIALKASSGSTDGLFERGGGDWSVVHLNGGQPNVVDMFYSFGFGLDNILQGGDEGFSFSFGQNNDNNNSNFTHIYGSDNIIDVQITSGFNYINGLFNTISGNSDNINHNSIFGYNNSILGDNNEFNFIYGSGNTINNNNNISYSFISGKNGVVRRNGEFVRSMTNSGQTGQHILWGRTTGNTATEIGLKGLSDVSSNRFTIENNSTYRIEFKVVVIDVNNGDSKEFETKCLVKTVSNTTSLVGTPTITSSFGDASLSTADFLLDAQNNYIRIRIQGVTSKTLNWMINSEYVKVHFNTTN